MQSRKRGVRRRMKVDIVCQQPERARARSSIEFVAATQVAMSGRDVERRHLRYAVGVEREERRNAIFSAQRHERAARTEYVAVSVKDDVGGERFARSDLVEIRKIVRLCLNVCEQFRLQ